MSKSALPGWAPPEVLQGLPYSEKSDIFNCGMLYWQIVTRDSEAFRYFIIYLFIVFHKIKKIKILI